MRSLDPTGEHAGHTRGDSWGSLARMMPVAFRSGAGLERRSSWPRLQGCCLARKPWFRRAAAQGRQERLAGAGLVRLEASGTRATAVQMTISPLQLDGRPLPHRRANRNPPL